MKARPIIFSSTMVRALLEGRKGQTRRVAKLPRESSLGEWQASMLGGLGVRTSKGVEIPEHPVLWHTRTGKVVGCPYGKPGDLLWVRETITTRDRHEDGLRYDEPFYRADMDSYGLCFVTDEGARYVEDLRWTPAIHMPRWASRLTLRITDVRVQRLLEISEADAQAEGVEKPVNEPAISAALMRAFGPDSAIKFEPYGSAFAQLWDSINGPGSSDANPWVWAITFDPILLNVDQVLEQVAA